MSHELNAPACNDRERALSSRIARNKSIIYGPTQVNADYDFSPRSIKDYADILWRRRAIFLATIVICTALAFLLVKWQRPIYRASSLVLFQNNPDTINIGGSKSNETTAQAEESFQTQVELLQSRSLTYRILAKLNNGIWNHDVGTKRYGRERELDFVGNNLKVVPIKGTRLIRIQVDSHDSQLAATFTNAVVSEYIAQGHEHSWKHKQADQEWLNEQVSKLRETIEHSERSLSSFVLSNGLMITASEKEASPNNRILRLQDELSKAQVERFTAETRHDMATNTSPEYLAEVVESTTLRDYQNKLTDLRQQLAQASSLWTSNHYKTKQLEAQIGVLKNAIEKERQQVAAKTKNDYQFALRREKLLSAEYVGTVKAVAEQAGKSLHYQMLRRDLDRDREIYDLMMQKLKQIEIASGLSTTNIRLVDAPEVPAQPHRPNVPLTCGLTFIASTFLGMMLAVTRENFGKTLQYPGESERYLNVSELGTIPSQRLLSPEFRSGESHQPGWRLPFLHRMRRADKSEVELATWNDSDSLTAQCFRATLASIFFSSGENTENTVSSIVVTSSVVGEGKTTIVSNLSLLLARMGKRVLVVDGDYRKPRLHKLFEISTVGNGLREMMDSGAPITLSTFAQKTKFSNLFLLSSGHVKTAFPEILQSSRISELMQAARNQFDFVLIDTPPVLHFPDARIWGRLADGVVLVIRAGETERQRAWSAAYTMANDGISFLGTILNDWDSRQGPPYDYTPKTTRS